MPRKTGPEMGDIWDYFGEERSGGRGAPESEPRGGGRELTPSGSGRSGKHWAEETKGKFDYVAPEEEIDPKIDRFVWSWVKKNPQNIVDILTGMYGLAGRSADAQEGVRRALDAARSALEIFPARTSANDIGRKIEGFAPSPSNFAAFKQALLNALPELIKAEKSRKANDKADALIYVADQIFDM